MMTPKGGSRGDFGVVMKVSHLPIKSFIKVRRRKAVVNLVGRQDERLYV